MFRITNVFLFFLILFHVLKNVVIFKKYSYFTKKIQNFKIVSCFKNIFIFKKMVETKKKTENRMLQCTSRYNTDRYNRLNDYSSHELLQCYMLLQPAQCKGPCASRCDWMQWASNMSSLYLAP